LVPFSNDNLLLQLPPGPGDNRSPSISRALSNRVFTDADDKAHVRTMVAREALKQGYAPCVRCLNRYLNAGLTSPSAPADGEAHASLVHAMNLTNYE
jgi:hypothetical protein